MTDPLWITEAEVVDALSLPEAIPALEAGLALEAAGTATPHQSTGLSLWIGIVLVLAGVAATLLATAQHARFLRRLDRGEPFAPPRFSLGTVVALGLAAIGVWMALYLLGVGR